MIYYEDSGARNARSNIFSVVDGCSKGVFEAVWRHGKSPWFSGCCICSVANVAWRGLVLHGVHGGFFLG